MDSKEKLKTMRLSITINEVQYQKIKEAATESGVSISAWLNIAAAEKLKNDHK